VKQPRGATGRNNLNAQRRKLPRKLLDSCLVGNANQRSSNRYLLHQIPRANNEWKAH
jgi:hypothetical protein